MPYFCRNEISMIHKNIQVFGTVQGVFFRKETRRKAQAIGLSGYVTNLADGSVFMEAEGSYQQVEELVNWCHQGPPLARVLRVETSDGEMNGFKEFEIR